MRKHKIGKLFYTIFDFNEISFFMQTPPEAWINPCWPSGPAFSALNFTFLIYFSRAKNGAEGEGMNCQNQDSHDFRISSQFSLLKQTHFPDA